MKQKTKKNQNKTIIELEKFKIKISSIVDD